MIALFATVLPNVGPIEVLEKFVVPTPKSLVERRLDACDLGRLQRLGRDLEDVAAELLLLTRWIFASP